MFKILKWTQESRPRYSVDIFHILVFQEYLVLQVRSIPLKLVLGHMRVIALSIGSHKQIQ